MIAARPRASVKRVLVIGSGGSGKTTFARRLAERTGLPLIHLDRLYWRPGWDPTPQDEWHNRVQTLIQQDAWILDGNYGGTLDMRLEACDTIVFLDIPRLICLWRVLTRQAQNIGRARAELPAGCPERLSWEFLKWIWTYPRTRRGSILQRLAALEARKQVVILHSTREMNHFLSQLPSRLGG